MVINLQSSSVQCRKERMWRCSNFTGCCVSTVYGGRGGGGGGRGKYGIATLKEAFLLVKCDVCTDPMHSKCMHHVHLYLLLFAADSTSHVLCCFCPGAVCMCLLTVATLC